MNILLIFFALPIATIIISIALQKIFKCPFLVSAIIFAIFLVVTFIVNNVYFLVATIVYAIIALITAYLVMIIQSIRKERNDNSCNLNCSCQNNRPRNSCANDIELLSIQGKCGNGNDGNLLTISSGCNGNQNDLLTIKSNCNSCNNSNCARCGNRCQTDDCNDEIVSNNQRISVQAQVVPNQNDNCSGRFSGCYRRR